MLPTAGPFDRFGIVGAVSVCYGAELEPASRNVFAKVNAFTPLRRSILCTWRAGSRDPARSSGLEVRVGLDCRPGVFIRASLARVGTGFGRKLASKPRARVAYRLKPWGTCPVATGAISCTVALPSSVRILGIAFPPPRVLRICFCS